LLLLTSLKLFILVELLNLFFPNISDRFDAVLWLLRIDSLLLSFLKDGNFILELFGFVEVGVLEIEVSIFFS